jgi:hypothetical protein
MVDRYWFQVSPWILYFALVAIAAAAKAAVNALAGEHRKVTIGVLLVPVAVVLAVHANTLPHKVQAARDFDRDGRVQVGPSNPEIAPIYAAVREHTEAGAVVAYFRARTMTLMTDRRAIQTADLQRICRVTDYFAQRRGSSYWQPAITAAEAAELGLEMVWNDSTWILWRVPEGCAGGPGRT